MTTSAPSITQAALDGPAKLREVSRLVDRLTADLQGTRQQPSDRDIMLSELLVFSRKEECSDPLFTEKAIETLARHAFENDSDVTSRNALKVLANAMRWRPKARQFFVNLRVEAAACQKLKTANCEDEFLVSRILFLTTYETDIDLLSLIDKHHLADVVVDNLAQHARRYAGPKTSNAAVDPMESMALIETLTLLFNLTSKCARRVDSFTPAIPHILEIFANTATLVSGPPLDPPTGPLINALMNLNLKGEGRRFTETLFPRDKPNMIVEKFLRLLDLSVRAYPGRQMGKPSQESAEQDRELEAAMTPLVSVMTSIYEDAPNNARQLMSVRLLPSDEDRQKAIGKADTLPSRLLRFSTHPATPELARAIQRLYFVLSDSDATKYVDNVGYGYASGFLTQNHIPMPGSAKQVRGVATNDGGSRLVNPITGQFLDAESSVKMPEMTDEEKEREAERLFVLFERLKTNGMINVQNPVEQAFRDGRIQELPDDDDKESPD